MPGNFLELRLMETVIFWSGSGETEELFTVTAVAYIRVGNITKCNTY